MKSKLYTLALATLMFTWACSKDSEETPNAPSSNKTMDELVIPEGFDFATDKNIEIELRALANDNSPMRNIRIDIYNGSSEAGGSLMYSGATDEQGYFKLNAPIPSYLKSVFVQTHQIGLPSETEVAIQGTRISEVLGGRTSVTKSSGGGVFKSTLMNRFYMGTFNNQGVPNYLESPNHVIDAQFLADINSSFPEAVPINPTYLSNSNEHDFKLTEACDVWVVFVHEGAGYKNVLGYYSYDLNNPPQSPADIDSGMIVFPNVSFTNSGGGLATGNKVYLGQFGAGKGIGFFLVSDGFRNGGVTNGIKTWYSNPAFNDESLPSKKKHNIVLVDQARDIFLMGFEDLIRSNGSSDEDFNDALFLVEANPIEAVDTDGFPPPDYVGTDDDNDGIPNNLDDYPTDPERAFNNYYPAKNTYGTLAFEDLWPGKGDYDFNDVVVDYNVNQVTNAQNKVVDVKPTYVLRARGASFHNGFGFQLNLLPSGVASVTGQRLTDNLVTLNANNTEAGQSKAVIMVFDNGSSILPYGGGNATGSNTTPGAPWVTPDTIRMNIHLTTPILASTFGYPPYNPFIFTNGNRSKEVHLADKAPTDLADLSLFGTAQDDSNPATGKYYKTKNNLPWAIHLTERFVYPNEKTPTNTGYNYFNQWAESGGTLYTDWYKNISGYRNTENLYE